MTRTFLTSPPPSTSGVTGEPRPPRGYFGELWHPVTYRHLAYHLLSVPLALLYFTVISVLLSFGAGLLVVVVGAAFLLLLLLVAQAFAELERVLGEALLDVTLPRPRRPLRSSGVWDWAVKTVTDAQTYKTALYLLLKLPFSLVAFTLTVTLVLPGVALVVGSVLPSGFWSGLDGLQLAVGGLGVRALLGVAGVGLTVLGVAVQNLLGRAWAFVTVQLLTDADGSQSARREAEALGRGAQAIPYTVDPQDTLRLLLARGLDASAACRAEVVTPDLHLTLGEDRPAPDGTGAAGRALLYP